MSLFDVIKYPISDIPTYEQLEAIPTEILEAWSQCYISNPVYKGNEVAELSKYFGKYKYNSHRIYSRWPVLPEAILHLREMIRDYNEPV